MLGCNTHIHDVLPVRKGSTLRWIKATSKGCSSPRSGTLELVRYDGQRTAIKRLSEWLTPVVFMSGRIVH